jgi:7-carboxy-7-deazaguanine synthase
MINTREMFQFDLLYAMTLLIMNTNFFNSEDYLLVNSIYKATEGEGVNIGIPQVFLRLQGCAIGCVNCDSMDTWAFDMNRAMKLTDISSKVESYFPATSTSKRLSITGGDPLNPRHRKNLLKLIEYMKKNNWFINIEASGNLMAVDVFELVDFISMDYKTPSTKVMTKIEVLEEALRRYPQNKIQIKSVVNDLDDYHYVLAAYEKVKQKIQNPISWVLTPAYNIGEVNHLEKFKALLKYNEASDGPFRFIGQQHKWFFGTEEKLC